MSHFSEKIRLLLTSFILIFSSYAAGQSPVLILEDPVVVYTSSQPGDPVYKAIEALQRDLEKVTGNKSRIKDLSSVDTPGIVVLNSAQDKLADPLSGWEAHRVFHDRLDKKPQVILQGSDMRGTIYAIYTFSEKILGVPPLWYYCGWEPGPERTVSIPSGLDIRFDAPEVKYRAWFPNDMDLLTPWRKRSKENDEIWLETALRLKLNTIEWLDAGKRAFDDKRTFEKAYAVSPTTELIRQHGLIYTPHHHNPLNASFENWEDYWKKIRNTDPPELLLGNEDKLTEYWRYNIETIRRSGLEMIWVIGFRGAGDHPFWYTFKDAPESMQERGKVISRMLKKQRDLVIEITGNPDAQFRIIFYDELSDLLAAGYLHPPDDPDLIWNFVAARRDHYPNEDLQQLDPGADLNLGYYFNYQFTSTGSHLAPAEGPWKMERNYRYVDGKSPKPILFSVVNAGNIREHVMELSANAAMLWDLKSYAAGRFLRDFCARYYGEALADTIAALYRDYYNAYWNQKKSDLPGFGRQYIFQDLRYRRAITQIAGDMKKGRYDPDPLEDLSNEQLPGRTFRIVPGDNGTDNQVDAIIRGTSGANKRFLEVKKSAERIEQQLQGYRKTFFHDNLGARASFMHELNKALLYIAEAYPPEPGYERTELTRQARNAVKNAYEVLQSTEHGPFRSWYAHSRVFDIEQLIRTLEDTFYHQKQVTSSGLDSGDLFNRDFISGMMKKVNRYQLQNPWTGREDYNWIRGTYYTGVMAAYQATGDQQYLEQCNRWGKAYDWGIPPVKQNAGASGVNVLTCTQTWLESYLIEPDEAKIRPVITHLLAPDTKNPVNQSDTWYFESGRRYADGLYTGPPALALLYKITGEERYANWLESCFWDVHTHLYDREAGLYYRDQRFDPENQDSIPEKYLRPDSIPRQEARRTYVYQYTPNGKKVFWSRGNGWVFAGIARILNYLPDDYPEQDKYLRVFTEMAESLKQRQPEDGYWRMNLDDPEDYPYPETSGTAFFTYALAMGINKGWLPAEAYRPVVEKAWKALCGAVSPEGKVQWGQPVGGGPYRICREDSHEYVSGMFLLAASELYKMYK